MLKAVILGVIQGLTEFLPISSTAHLRIIPSILGWNDIGAAYTAVIQVGTMFAIIIYFRENLIYMFLSVLKSLKEHKILISEDSRLLLYIIIGTLPIIVFGFTLKDFIRNEFRDLYLISVSLIFFSIMIFVADRVPNKFKLMKDITIKDSLIIGIFQAFALIPGASRSGSTISGSFFRKLDRESAARFSFLLSIPAILLSGAYELISERDILFNSNENIISLLIATIVSGLVGYWSIGFLISYIKKHSLIIFVIYRVLLGVLIIILSSAGFIKY